MIIVFFVVDSLKYFNIFFFYLIKLKNIIRYNLYVDMDIIIF